MWVDTVLGRKMPLDRYADPVHGNIRWDPNHPAEIVTGPALARERAASRPLFVSHFASCPNADAHRKPAPKADRR